MAEKQKFKPDILPPIHNLFLQSDFQFITPRPIDDCADFLLDWREAKTPAGGIEQIEAFSVDERTVRYAILMTGHYQQRVWTVGTLNRRHDGQTVIRGQIGVALPVAIALTLFVALLVLVLTWFSSPEAGSGLFVICLAIALMWLISVRSMRREVERMLFSLKT